MSAISFTDSQLFSYVAQYTSEDKWPQDSADKCGVAKSVVTVLEQNSARLTIAYLPLLEKIVQKKAFTEYPIYNSRVLGTYKAEIAKYVPDSISAAVFIKLQLAEEFVIAYGARKGNTVHIARLIQHIVQLAKDEKTEKAELLLSYFLEYANSDTQKKFLGLFDETNFSQIRTLFFEKTYPRVKSLCFANNCPRITDEVQDLNTYIKWDIFCSEIITACPNLTSLKIEIEQQGELPEDIVTAIGECRHLENLDVSHFYISRNRSKMLKVISKLPSLKRLWLQIEFTHELLKLSDEFYPKLRGLFLRHEGQAVHVSEHPVDDKKKFLEPCNKVDEISSQNLINKCVRLKKLRLSSDLTIRPQVQIKRFELVLSKTMRLPVDDVADHVKELVLYPSPQDTYQIYDTKEIIAHFPKLTSLHVERLSPPDLRTGLDNKSYFDIIREKRSLKQLAIQVCCHTKYVAELPSLCTRLSSLHLKLMDSVDQDDEIKTALNSSSQLQRLALEVDIPGTADFQRYLAPFLYATNPEELLLMGFSPAQTITLTLTEAESRKQIELTASGKKFSLKPFSRLKRLILCHSETSSLWEFSNQIKPYVYKTFEVESQASAYAIDIESINK
jgi:hypothetical protein